MCEGGSFYRNRGSLCRVGCLCVCVCVCVCFELCMCVLDAYICVLYHVPMSKAYPWVVYVFIRCYLCRECQCRSRFRNDTECVWVVVGAGVVSLNGFLGGSLGCCL